MLFRRGMHQSNTVVRHSTTKLLNTPDASCREAGPFTRAMVNKKILKDKLSTCLIGI